MGLTELLQKHPRRSWHPLMRIYHEEPVLGLLNQICVGMRKYESLLRGKAGNKKCKSVALDPFIAWVRQLIDAGQLLCQETDSSWLQITCRTVWFLALGIFAAVAKKESQAMSGQALEGVLLLCEVERLGAQLFQISDQGWQSDQAAWLWLDPFLFALLFKMHPEQLKKTYRQIDEAFSDWRHSWRLATSMVFACAAHLGQQTAGGFLASRQQEAQYFFDQWCSQPEEKVKRVACQHGYRIKKEGLARKKTSRIVTRARVERPRMRQSVRAARS